MSPAKEDNLTHQVTLPAEIQTLAAEDLKVISQRLKETFQVIIYSLPKNEAANGC